MAQLTTRARRRRAEGAYGPDDARGDGGVPIEVAGVRLTRPDRVLFSGQGLTKRRLAEYFVAVAPRLLPHLVGRPLSLVRCPRGAEQGCFFQRHAGRGLPKTIRRVWVDEPEGRTAYLAVDDLGGLLSLVQLGVLELHPWAARAENLEHPDRLIFDLDPAEELPWARVAAAAVELRRRLAGLGLQSFVKTTGGKGLHVVLPLAPARLGWAEVRRFARAVAEAMAQDRPQTFTSSAAKAERPGRIFVDYLRNAHGASAVAPYSPRAKPGAPVATPLDWTELDETSPLAPAALTVTTLPQRLAALREDPWAGLPTLRQTITAEAQRALGLVAANAS